MAMFGAVFETAFVRGLDVAGEGDEVLQLDTTVTETPNEVLTVAASTDVEAMLRASTTAEYLMRPSVQWTSEASPSADTKQTPRSGSSITFIGNSLRNLKLPWAPCEDCYFGSKCARLGCVDTTAFAVTRMGASGFVPLPLPGPPAPLGWRKPPLPPRLFPLPPPLI